jgi:ornithine cyclodeaminase
MRTAAMTGVGTRRLAQAGADDMAIIGTGKQALTQVAACTAVRPLKHLRIFSRNPEARANFTAAVEKNFDFRVTTADSLEQAVKDAPIVTLITNATEPFFTSAMAARGSHINAMGAIVPARTEFTDDIFSRCEIIAVDSMPGVRALSNEFRSHFGDDDGAWQQVRTISSLIADDAGRPGGCDLTLFKAMGMGISDLALSVEILERARAGNAGHALPERVRTPPRLHAE